MIASCPALPRRPQTIAVQAPEPEREADEIARRILELHTEGTDFPDIAVALRDIDAWLPLLHTTFDRFGIPARAYFSSPVAKHPVAIFLNGLIACALKDWDFASVLAALRPHPAWGHKRRFRSLRFQSPRSDAESRRRSPAESLRLPTICARASPIA